MFPTYSLICKFHTHTHQVMINSKCHTIVFEFFVILEHFPLEYEPLFGDRYGLQGEKGGEPEWLAAAALHQPEADHFFQD